MAEKPLPTPDGAIEQQHEHPHAQAEQPQPAQSHDNSPGDNAAAGGDSPAAVDPVQGLSGLDGASDPMSNMDPSSFLQPIQELGSKVGELPQQLSQGVMSGVQPALQAMQGMASQLGQPAGGLPGAGSPGGGNKVELDPEKAHATTSRAEADTAEHLAKSSTVKPVAGHAPTDASVVAVATKYQAFKTAAKAQLAESSESTAASRRIGTSIIEAADEAAAGEQSAVRGGLI